MAYGYRRYPRPRRKYLPPPPEQVIEFPSIGATYRREEFGVYEYSEYGPTSVLAGQQKRVWLGGYSTLEEAKAAYPKASGPQYASGYAPPSLEHLPDNEAGDLENYEREQLAREGGQ